jgi:hypothetical protein
MNNISMEDLCSSATAVVTIVVFHHESLSKVFVMGFYYPVVMA